jgi:amino acid permease
MTVLSKFRRGGTSTKKGKEPSEPKESAVVAQRREEDSSDADSQATLKREIPLGELVFLAISGSIGAGLFVASGGALSSGGPANVVINYLLTGVLVVFTMGALGEMCSEFSILTIQEE